MRRRDSKAVNALSIIMVTIATEIDRKKKKKKKKNFLLYYYSISLQKRSIFNSLMSLSRTYVKIPKFYN